MANQDENQSSGSTDLPGIARAILKKILTLGICLEIQKMKIERNGLRRENNKQRFRKNSLLQNNL